jgi:L-fucose mutarotase/ribose pyranase (RbsD/FucU family)
VERPVITTDCSGWDDEPESSGKFRKVIEKHFDEFTDFELVKRFDLYERAGKAYVTVVINEPDGDVTLKKGPVMMQCDSSIGLR